MQLAEAGEDAAARAAHRAWAVAFAEQHARALFSPEQFAAVDARRGRGEQPLRRPAPRARERRPGSSVQLLAALAASGRSSASTPACSCSSTRSPTRWRAGRPRRSSPTRPAALAIDADQRSLVAIDQRTDTLRAAASPPRARRAATRGSRRWSRCCSTSTPRTGRRSSRGCANSLTTPTATSPCSRCQWLSHALENPGDPAGAMDAAERGLARAATTTARGPRRSCTRRPPSSPMHLGDGATAVAHAHAALPVLERLGAADDMVQLHALLALARSRRVDLGRRGRARAARATTTARRCCGGLGRPLSAAPSWPWPAATSRPGWPATARRWNRCAPADPGVPATGLEPWVLLGEADRPGRARPLRARPATADAPDAVRARRDRALRRARPRPSRPGLSGLRAGAVRARRAGVCCTMRLPRKDAVRLLVLADRFAYNRVIPTMSWDASRPRAEELAPGLMAVFAAEYGDARGPDLLDEARAPRRADRRPAELTGAAL